MRSLVKLLVILLISFSFHGYYPESFGDRSSHVGEASGANIEGSATPTTSAVRVGAEAFNDPFKGPKQIIRSSSGRIYYFYGNDGNRYVWDGSVMVSSSTDGINWSKVSVVNEWHQHTRIGVGLDSQDIVHMITYNWTFEPTYQKFHTSDSVKGDHSWEGSEIIDRSRATGGSLCAIAIDANDVPHVIYQRIQSDKGIDYITLHYANRIDGVWKKITLIPVEAKVQSLGAVDLAIGPDNVPYLLIYSKMLKGNDNNPSSFEEMDLGGSNHSFVIHSNGDVRVGLTLNGNYAHYVHDATMPWQSGWTLFDSGQSGSGVLVLSNDVPYTIGCPASLCQAGTERWIQEWFDPPRLLVTVPQGYGSITSFTTRWSYYNHHFQTLIDLGAASWRPMSYPYYGAVNYYWYACYRTETIADFSASPIKGSPPLNVTFTDLSSTVEGVSVIAWEWDFDNDGVTDSTDENPIFTYSDPGHYTVSLTVTDSSGITRSKVKTDLILVDFDSDGDTFLDAEDNCQQQYNVTQVDLDGDGIGDVCDSDVVLLHHATMSSSLSNPSSNEGNPASVTEILKDGLLDQAVRIRKSKGKGKYDVLNFQLDADAKELTSINLGLYVSATDTGTAKTARIYSYNSDGISVNTSGILDVNLSPGWNDIDLSVLLPFMEGFGFVKFRLATLSGWIDIAEAYITGTSARRLDDWEISVAPLALDFGSIDFAGYAWRNLSISNTGTGDLRMGSIPAPPSPFTIVSDGCSNRTLSTGSSPCSVAVAFSPQAEGTHANTLTIPSNDWDNPSVQVQLHGSTTPPASVTGTVLDEPSGLPLAGATASVSQGMPHSSCPADYSYGPDNWTSQDYEAARENDEIKFVGEKQANNGEQIFKVRNPYNGVLPAKITWNGVGADSRNRVLGQSFVSGATGQLTKVSLKLSREEWPPTTTFGILKVFLKSRVGGDKDAILAFTTGHFLPTRLMWCL